MQLVIPPILPRASGAQVVNLQAGLVSQLATAALLLPTFFLRDILGMPAGAPLLPQLSPWLLAAWACFLVSVLFGVTYQITAARLIGDAYSNTQSRRFYPNQQFWALTVALALGLAFLVAAFVQCSITSMNVNSQTDREKRSAMEQR